MDHEAMRQYLKTLEPDASDSLGDLGCNMIENAIDALSEKFNLTEEEVEELSTKLAVGVTFELEDDREISTEDMENIVNYLCEVYSFRSLLEDFIEKLSVSELYQILDEIEEIKIHSKH